MDGRSELGVDRSSCVQTRRRRASQKSSKGGALDECAARVGVAAGDEAGFSSPRTAIGSVM